jgi:YgiT-type zinc finger domain-containing protein
MIKITTCPTCGSKKIKRLKRDWVDEFKGETYIVPALEFYECPDCGERLYDAQAMRKIEAHSPAYAKKRRRKEAA